MKHTLMVFVCLVWVALAHATLTLHIQSPYRNDAVMGNEAVYGYHITGEVTSWNADFAVTSNTRMTSEGDHWFSYTWDKSLADYPNGGGFKINVCSDTADVSRSYNNHCDTWEPSSDFSFKSLFADETEVWLYTTETSYTFSVVPPGSKVVWFKSPWGNHALPQMIFGTDSIMMRFAQDDQSKCGWFYGAVSPEMLARNPLQSAHFIRLYTPYMSVPTEGVIELDAYFAVMDTVFVDGTAGGLVGAKITTLGQCFDSTRTLHVYNPWRTNSTYKDSALYISVGNNIINNPVAMDGTDEYKFWWHYDFHLDEIKPYDWNGAGARVNFHSSQNQGKRFWNVESWEADTIRPAISSFFPKGVYETWVYTTTTGNIELIFSPLEEKVVRLMSPWDNMTPTMFVDGDTVKMAPFHSDTCGWYQGVSYKHVESWEVYFRQAFGFEYFSRSGLDTIPGTLISLDSIFAESDTAWITSIPFLVTTSYPKRLGVCPSMKISALVVDWAGEAFHDSIDIDFGHIYNNDGKNTYITVEFDGVEYNTCQGQNSPTFDGVVTGMVQDTLVNGYPARVDSLHYPWSECSAAHEIEKWFIPQVVATDANGKEYTNGVCRDIDLTMDEEGFWLADISEAHEDGGFFPVDDFQYLDSARTVLNPKYDWKPDLMTNNGKQHNYSFAMKISAQFKYVKGQYFEFRGDDDVWVFINNRLVVDIGGCHNPAERAVNLDTLGLTEGVEYPFHIFFSERNSNGSNFKMRTSINLQTERTYFSKQKENPDGSVEYEFHQLLVDKSVSCDVASVQNARDQLAQSVFILKGGNLPADGVTLETGSLYGGGIIISEDMAGVKIDTAAFVNSRQLSPGKYALYCFLATDYSQYQVITFTVPEYPLPDIAFVDVFHVTDSAYFDPTGYTLRGDVMGLDGGKNDTLLAHVTYPDTVPIKVALLFGTATCGELAVDADINCVQEINLNTKFPLSFLDKDNQRVTSISTDSLGFASFYVVGDSAMVDAFFTVGGAGVNNILTWKNIHFKEPPVPFAQKAKMYDVNGDGIPDSLVIPFSKAFDKVVPDTLSWSFGGTEFHTTAGQENVWPLVVMDSVIIMFNPEGLRKDVFTGVSDQIYSGSLLYHYTYTDEDSGEEVKLSMNTSIEDKVAPIVTSAVIEPLSDDMSVVTISLSEGSDDKTVDRKTAFVFYRGPDSFMDSLYIASANANPNGNVVRLYFQRTPQTTLPEVGDYVRLLPGEFKDRSGNVAHVNNPKVRIVGEQRTEIQAPGVVTISSNPEAWPHKDPVAPMVVPANMPLQDIIDSVGLPGLLLNFNIGELATSTLMNLPSDADKDSALALIRIKWDAYYFSHLGNFVNKAGGVIACNDKAVFYNAANPEQSNCYDNPGNLFFEWNARSEKGRMVGTGAYITKMKVKIMNGSEKAGSSDDTYTIGIRRGK
jgi:fibro-slime domain-containing protein